MTDSEFDSVIASSAGVVASCPGKVLISGGYLVLDENHQGNVLALNARLQCQVATLAAIPLNIPYPEAMTVMVFASQRLPGPAILSFNKSEDFTLRSSQGSNVFLTKSVVYALLVANQLNPSCVSSCPGLALKIEADGVFYTGEGKTGLGSSACLVSSIVSAVLRYFEIWTDEGETRFLEMAHNLAQFVHCAAQGKVGSGFDVSTAFYGSQTYQRFSPNILETLLQLDQRQSVDVGLLIRCVTSKWNTVISSFKLPPHFDVVLADVKSGSETPSMVKKVLQWKQEDCKSSALWESLGQNNRVFSKLIHTLRELHDISPKDYVKAIYHCLSYPPEELIECEQPIMRIMGETREQFLTIRSQLKEMGRQAGVEIEPDSQSALLDACMRIPGVVCAGVPGAGGFDAIFLLILNPGAAEGHESVLSSLQRLWVQKGFDVSVLNIREDTAGLVMTQL
eukprot:TRINITY_DN24212_c0_g1_i2.p1 TRINITY_DN24212_c0_g1~~TRINITY_DN24212_c0_g1_i2.p1  ORF type:complete len:479 (-),score=83.66 TRINITY_DN24212_c0_g1_i2:1396-2751(-)